jgi:hypothetical protein
MTWRAPGAAWWAVFVAAMSASALLCEREDERLRLRPVAGQVLFSQDSDDEDGGSRRGGPRTYQRIQKTGAQRSATYGFTNFNRDKLEVSVSMAEKDFDPYNDAFGYRKSEVEALRKWRDDAKQSAWKLAVKQGKSQAQLDAAVAALDKEYAVKLKAYLASKGFKQLPGNVVAVDMPLLVRGNGPKVKTIATAIDKVAQSRRYASPEIIGAALSFVQTALHYKQPDPVHSDKHTGGVLPPLTAALLGWGDCDTKTGLLASVLSNWSQMRMVGVSVPGHYLMGVLLIPEKGDLFLEHNGLQYVLVEPAGPAWLPPGKVGEDTVTLLNGREGYTLEPFF